VIKNRPAALRERFDQLAGEGLTLVTNNVREFQRMPGLRIDNWVQKPMSTEAEPAPSTA